MAEYSVFSLIKNALTGHRNWQRWQDPGQNQAMMVIVGGGGHGLATAFYLAKVPASGMLLFWRRGWLGSGNTGRNDNRALQLYARRKCAFLRNVSEAMGKFEPGSASM